MQSDGNTPSIPPSSEAHGRLRKTGLWWKLSREWVETGRGSVQRSSPGDRRQTLRIGKLASCLVSWSDGRRYVILSRRRKISAGDNSVEPVVDSKPYPPDILSPDFSLALNACSPERYELPSDALSIPPCNDLPANTLGNPGIGSLPTVPNPYPVPGKSTAFQYPACSPATVATFPSSDLTSNLGSYGPSMAVPIGCQGRALGAASTLVLDHLQPETVNMVIDTLLQTNSKFGMRLYNTGS